MPLNAALSRLQTPLNGSSGEEWDLPGADLPGGHRELSGQSEVEQVYGVAGRGAAPYGEVAGLNISV